MVYKIIILINSKEYDIDYSKTVDSLKIWDSIDINIMEDKIDLLLVFKDIFDDLNYEYNLNCVFEFLKSFSHLKPVDDF